MRFPLLLAKEVLGEEFQLVSRGTLMGKPPLTIIDPRIRVMGRIISTLRFGRQETEGIPNTIGIPFGIT